MNNFRDTVVRLINKTHSPIAPIAFQNLANGIEQVARVLSNTATKEKADAYAERLLKDFSDEELMHIGNKADFLTALLAITKTSTIRFCQPEL